MRRMILTVILGSLLAGTVLLTTGCAQPDDGTKIEKPGKTYEAPTNIELSNGYFIRQFMGSGQSIAKATAVDDVNHYLGEAETYIKGLVNELEQSVNGNTYFNDFINGYKDNDSYKITGTGSGAHAMDYLLSINANNYTYILEDIIKNVDLENRYIFSSAYQFLANEAQHAGLGNVKSLGTELAETVYTKEKQNLKGDGEILGINFDVNINTGVPEITNKMDEILNQAAGNMYGVTANDLKKVINISLTNNSLGALHDAQVNNLEHNLKAGCTMEYHVGAAYGDQGLSYTVYNHIDMALTNARYAAAEADKNQAQDYVMGR